jgi:hypothetical protein
MNTLLTFLQRVRLAVGRIAWLSPLRRRIGRALLMPWEYPTLFGLNYADHFPAFARGHDHEAEAVESIRIVRHHTMTKYDRCAVLHNLVRHLERHAVPGALVECGVWKGGSAGLMALANLRYGRARRPLYLFDAWVDDWPDPTPEDGEHYHEAMSGRMIKTRNVGSLDSCRELLEKTIRYPADLIHYEKGLFADTLPKARGDIGQTALLRLDGDWYESIRCSLDNLYPTVVARGIVVIDDYGYSQGAKKAVDEHVATLKVPVYLHYVDYSCRYFFKP